MVKRFLVTTALEVALLKAQVLLLARTAMVLARLEFNKDFFLYNKHVPHALVLVKSSKKNVEPVEVLGPLKKTKLFQLIFLQELIMAIK